MSSMNEAIDRLNAALERLEVALESDAEAGGAAGGADSERLRAAMAEVQRRNEELSSVADQVAERLDRAVGHVSALLEA